MNPDKTFLVVGADGMFGGALIAKWASRPFLATTHRVDTISDRRIFLDLTDGASELHPPDGVAVAVICSAITSIERCRLHPDETARFNVNNTLKVAKSIISNGTFVIFLSTNLVYDGSIAFRKAEDPVCPHTEYGRQKAEVEKQLLALGNLASVVRFTKVIGPEDTLLRAWIHSLQNQQTIHPFSDMVMSPISLAFAVGVIDRVANSRLPGIFQVSGSEDITYEEAARYIARRMSRNQDLVEPIRSSEAGLPFVSAPAHTTLDITRLHADLGLETPCVWSTLELMLSL